MAVGQSPTVEHCGLGNRTEEKQISISLQTGTTWIFFSTMYGETTINDPRPYNIFSPGYIPQVSRVGGPGGDRPPVTPTKSIYFF